MSIFRYKTIHQLLASQAKKNAERSAISDGEGLEISYARLLKLVDVLINDMSNAGVKPADRISIVMPNGVDMAVVLLAVSSFSTAVPLNPDYKSTEYRSYFKDLGVRWVILPEDSSSPSAEIAEELDIGILHYDMNGSFRIRSKSKNRAASKFNSFVANDEDICLILLTSGSTGRSKKVPLTNRQVMRSVSDICETLLLSIHDVCLCMWEQFHIGGLVDLLLVPLASGGKVICAGSFNASDLARLLVPEGVTWFQAVPTTLHELMLHIRSQKLVIDAPRLRFIRAVASALSPSMMVDVEAMFRVPVLQTFGMTEASPLITTNRLPPGKRKLGSVGTSCGPEIKVQDIDGIDVPLGQRGEIVIRGENVITAYEDAPETNEISFRDGWFRTGDTGYFDEEGFLYLTGRIKEMINRGGEKITPQEIDDVLQTHPSIAQAASFSVSHPVLGEDVAAAIVLKPDHELTETQVREFTSAKLANFKIPQRIIFLPEMPRDPVGKINRLTLSTLAQNKTPEAHLIRKLGKDLKLSAQPTIFLSSLEERIASIWARELNLPHVDPNDNFFELGGHSLAGVRVILAIEAEFEEELPDDVWAKVTTVREMTNLIFRGIERNSKAIEENERKRTTVNDPPPFQTMSAFYVQNIQFATSNRGKVTVGISKSIPSILPAYLRTLQLVMNAGQIRTLSDFPTIKSLNPNGKHEPLFWVFNSPEREMTGLKTHWDSEQPLFGLHSGSKNLPRTDEVFEMVARHYAQCIIKICPLGNFSLGGNCRGAKMALLILQILEEHKLRPRRFILMEHGTDEVINYPLDILFLFGRHSRVRAYESMSITDVLDGKHQNVRVRWIDGQHGEFFIPMNVGLLARRLLAFLRGNDRSQEYFEGLRSRLTWRAHSSELRFERLIERYKKRKKQYEAKNLASTVRK